MAQKNKRKNNKRRVKIKPVPVAILAAVILAAAGVTVSAVSSRNKGEEETTVNVNVSQLPRETQDSTRETVMTTVDIDLESCSIPVGTTLMATATVTPADTEDALVWTTGDPSILTVDENGFVTVTGVGTTTLTATVGTVSDGIIIEGIESYDSTSVNNLPKFDPASYTAGLGAGSSSSSGRTGSGSSSGYSSGGSGSSSSGGNSVDFSGTGNNTVDENDNDDNGGGNDSDYSGGGSSDNNGGGNSGSSDNGGGSSDYSGAQSTDLYGSLESLGYEHKYSNVFVYQEGDTYCGEIIIQSNLAIIYIKQRTSGFDAKIMSVLSEMVPDSAEQVWNNYLSAGSDRTFTVDGRKVRIVTALKGGHSQIVIYN